MKLVRFGPLGREKPGIINADWKIRDLSKICRTSAVMFSPQKVWQKSARQT
jgi:hypothetical protein